MHASIYDINRKHTVDETYFSDIDTEQKAYWLGLLWADGHISKTAPRCSGPNRLRITQKEQETALLEKFLEDLSSNYELKSNISQYGTISSQLDINSRPLCQSLERLGFAKKDQRCHIPKIPANLNRHFVRGYFDGDGCLSVYDQKRSNSVTHRQEWSLTGDPKFIAEIKSLLETEADVTSTVSIKRYARTDKAVTLRYGKISDIEKLYSYLYDEATRYMESKHEKFMSYFSRRA